MHFAKPLPPFIFLLALLFPRQFAAQSLPKTITRKIDSLFAGWNAPNSAGCAIGMVRNDSLIYAKGYGMANLEYNVPITMLAEIVKSVSGKTIRPFTDSAIKNKITGFEVNNGRIMHLAFSKLN